MSLILEPFAEASRLLTRLSRIPLAVKTVRKSTRYLLPEQHAGALDPNVAIVLGSRGAGKSFWAGILGDNETRKVAAEAYPQLRLDKTIVRFGFTFAC